MGKNTTIAGKSQIKEAASVYALHDRTSLADALFTTSQQRVLALLFGQPERSFFTKELIDLARGGRGAVQRELMRLQESGLITQSAVGNQKHYRANKQSPIFAELHGIVTKVFGPSDRLRAALAPLEPEIDLALLYGSSAKNRDTAQSDIDVLVVSDSLTLEQLYTALEGAEAQLGRTISPTLYTRGEFSKRIHQANPFVTKVLKGETIALIGDKGEFAAAG